MATYLSGQITFGGLTGDTDFTDMISKLKQVEMRKANQLYRWREDWNTRVKAFQQVRTAMVELQTSLKTMNTVDKFMVKNAASSKAEVAKAVAGEGTSKGVYNVEVNQLANNASWSLHTSFSDKNAIINSGPGNGTFEYEYKGKIRSINVPPGTTLEGLKNMINNDSQNPGVTVQLIENQGNGLIFQIRGKDTGNNAQLNLRKTTDIDGLALSPQPLWSSPVADTLRLDQTFTSDSDVINPNSGPRNFVVSDGMNEYTISLKANGTVKDLMDAFEAAIPGATANFTGSQLELTYTGGLTVVSSDIPALAPTRDDTWNVQYAQNAEIRYNNWPASGWLELESNTVKDVLDKDLTVTLLSEGQTTITVELDTSAMEEKVYEFVDAVNKFRKTLQVLTEFSENKDVFDPDYAESQYEMQKGSVLTGNYGIQMIASRFKSVCANSGTGFMRLDDGVGDVFSALSQIGIMTNATQGDEMYGMLEVNQDDSNGKMTLSKALSMDPEGIATLFGAKSQGYSTSPYFGHVSHIDGITEAGIYDVKYTISGGVITGTINGKPIVQDGNNIGIYSNTPPPNAADGLVIEVYNLEDASYEGQIGIKQGKVNELLGLMDGSDGYLGKEGTLAILENNYKKIMENVDKKIQQEDERIVRWERTIKNRFARLEATIAKYQQINKDLTTQISQLSSSSSSNK